MPWLSLYYSLRPWSFTIPYNLKKNVTGSADRKKLLSIESFLK